jgi:hypothetical protein
LGITQLLSALLESYLHIHKMGIIFLQQRKTLRMRGLNPKIPQWEVVKSGLKLAQQWGLSLSELMVSFSSSPPSPTSPYQYRHSRPAHCIHWFYIQSQSTEDQKYLLKNRICAEHV